MPSAALATTGSVLTATEYNYLPRGYVIHATATTNQTTISAEVDLTSLSVSIPMVSGRRYLITAHVDMQGTADGSTVLVKLTDASNTQLTRGQMTTSAANTGDTVSITYIETAASTATVTRKLRAVLAAGSGTFSVQASSTSPALLLVQDIGVA